MIQFHKPEDRGLYLGIAMNGNKEIGPAYYDGAKHAINFGSTRSGKTAGIIVANVAHLH